ncbi:MAG: hypothetical protein J5569_05055 [Oscillospiraceae bacterium]|nr:hypothetical protein [Oscillospiraceae bacterium]
MNTLNKVTRIIARIIEICHWAGACVMLVLLGCCVFSKSAAEKMIFGDFTGTDSIYGFSFKLTDAAGQLDIRALTVLAIAGVILFALVAMIFRNIYLVVKTSEGKTKFSKGATPFQPEIVRMLRKIGIYAIAVPVVGFIMSVVGHFVVGPEFSESSVDLTGIVFGLIVLWLTQVFTRGVELEQDADGLI